MTSPQDFTARVLLNDHEQPVAATVEYFCPGRGSVSWRAGLTGWGQARLEGSGDVRADETAREAALRLLIESMRQTRKS